MSESKSEGHVVAQIPLPIDRRKKRILAGVQKLGANSSDESKDDLLFLYSPFASLSLPHKKLYDKEKVDLRGNKTEALVHSVINGDIELQIIAHPDHGLPYGTYPRLFRFWFCSEIVRTGSETIVLGSSLRDFMRALGFNIEGGSQPRRFLEQIKRFLHARYILTMPDPTTGKPTTFFEKGLWRSYDYSPWESDDMGVSSITFDKEFVDELKRSAAPFKKEALIGLQGSTLALDLYTWLCYRIYHMYRKNQTYVPIPLESFALQLGCNWSRMRDFRSKLKQALNEVLVFYPEADVTIEKNRLILKRSPLAVSESERKQRLSVVPE